MRGLPKGSSPRDLRAVWSEAVRLLPRTACPWSRRGKIDVPAVGRLERWVSSMRDLELKDIPMVGKDGKRDNLEALLSVLRKLARPGSVLHAYIYHDDACPCEKGDKPITECTCQTVDITLGAEDGHPH